MTAKRSRDLTEVVIVFKYGNERVDKHLGILDEESDYQMSIFVNFAGVVTNQPGIVGSSAQQSKP